jgi:phage terminase Nu1 subunit (DNA packaging protein)
VQGRRVCAAEVVLRNVPDACRLYRTSATARVRPISDAARDRARLKPARAALQLVAGKTVQHAWERIASRTVRSALQCRACDRDPEYLGIQQGCPGSRPCQKALSGLVVLM